MHTQPEGGEAWRALHRNTKQHLVTARKRERETKTERDVKKEEVAVATFDVYVQSALPWLHQSQQTREQLKHKGLTRVERRCASPPDHQETTSRTTTAHQVRDKPQETTPGEG